MLELKTSSFLHRNQPSSAGLGAVSDRGGHLAGGPAARQQTGDQWAHLGLRGLERSGVGERFCEYSPRGRWRRRIRRVRQPRPGHPLRGRLGLWPQGGEPGQIVSGTKGDLTSFLPHESEMSLRRNP